MIKTNSTLEINGEPEEVTTNISVNDGCLEIDIPRSDIGCVKVVIPAHVYSHIVNCEDWEEDEYVNLEGK